MGSKSTKTALGTCLPAPVSLKNVLKLSSPPPCNLSEGICPSGWIPCSKQYNSQQAFPIWTPAWPTWTEIHSRCREKKRKEKNYFNSNSHFCIIIIKLCRSLFQSEIIFAWSFVPEPFENFFFFIPRFFYRHTYVCVTVHATCKLQAASILFLSFQMKSVCFLSWYAIKFNNTLLVVCTRVSTHSICLVKIWWVKNYFK